MSLETFLHNLQFETDKVRPSDWEVDWADAPLSYKLYRGLPVYPLSSEVPLSLDGRLASEKPKLREIGHFLWYVFGLTQFSQSMVSSEVANQDEKIMQLRRRFVPSGGGCYPNELYLYLKIEDLPSGIYHYDVAHHRLVLLREGEFDTYLARATGNRCDLSACFGTIFVSTLFWKNYFKYSNFAYRLQALDAGALIGQLQEVSNRFGYSSGVYFQFLDRAINHLLGLSEQSESTYAIIPLSVRPANTWFDSNRSGSNEVTSSSGLSKELPAVRHVQYNRSRNIKEYPMLIKMNEASLLESVRSFHKLKKEETMKSEAETIALPQVKRLNYDLTSASRMRYSPDNDFVLAQVSQLELASLLQEAMASFSYLNDLDDTSDGCRSRFSIYGCLYGVEGIPNGAYQYDSEAHELRLVRSGDHRLWLQQAMFLWNVNLFQVPLCLHVVGDRDHLSKALSYRGYRIQQMEAGIIVQRLLLAASVNGMGGHPLLGFEVNACDEIYQIAPHGKTCLIQIPIGPYRPRARLTGGLYS